MLPLHKPPMVASPVVETGALGVSDQCSTTELRSHLVNFVCLYRVYHTLEIVSTDSTENLKIPGNTKTSAFLNSSAQPAKLKVLCFMHKF